MGSTILRRWAFVIAAAGVTAALAPGHAAGAGGGISPRDILCYVDDDAAAMERARDEMQAQFGIHDETSVRRVRTRSGSRSEMRVAMVFRLPAGTDAASSDSAARMRRVRERAGLREVVRDAPSRARGAPTQIPVFDGDLDARSVTTQYAVVQCSLDVAQSGASGGGILVAVLDGGFDLLHPHLAGRLSAAAWDTLDDDADAQDAGNGTDDDGDGVADNLVGHGTFVSSVILAASPGATILPLRCLDDEGFGTQAAVAHGIQRAIDSGADVINMSLTIPAASEMVRDAIHAALEAGIPVVVAAGNEAQWQFDPRIAGRVVTVGAVDSTDTLAEFSETGDRVAVYAPGVAVVGAIGGRVPGSYGRWSGTSFATAWVSGAVALTRQMDATESPRGIRNDVVRTADDAYDVSGRRGRLAADELLEATR